MYKFSDSSTVSQTFHLNVQIANTSHEIVITRGLRPVVVPEFNGLSNPIDSSVIRFYFSGKSNVTCTVSFSSQRSTWPIAGHIVEGEGKTSVDTMQKSCTDFVYSKLYYQHVQSPNPDVDYLPLTVELHDRSSGSQSKQIVVAQTIDSRLDVNFKLANLKSDKDICTRM